MLTCKFHILFGLLADLPLVSKVGYVWVVLACKEVETHG